MSPAQGIGLPEALERAAEALAADADAIRPANGDPSRLLELLDADGAGRVLAWLLAHEPSDAAELAEAWAEDAERGVPPLLSVAEEGLPKAGRKVLRRVRHQLRSRGIELPEAEREAVVAKLPPVEERLDEALLSPIDPRGSRAAFLVTSHPSGGVRMFELVLDELRGVLETRVYSAGRTQVRRFMKSFSQRDALSALPAPPDSGRALVRRIAEGQPADRPLPRSFLEWRAQLADAPEAAPTPGELAQAELGPVEPEPARLRRAAELVTSRALGPWPPEAEALHRLAEQIGETARGRVIVAGAQRREQVERVLEQGLDELFAEPVGARTAQRFEESAYCFWKRGSEDDARVCLAAARAFRDTSPAENPVAKAMIEVVLAPVLAKLDEEIGKDEEASRLVTPQKGELNR